MDKENKEVTPLMKDTIKKLTEELLYFKNKCNTLETKLENLTTDVKSIRSSTEWNKQKRAEHIKMHHPKIKDKKLKKIKKEFY